MLGVAIADSSMQTFGLCEFADDDEYSTLEACALLSLPSRLLM